MMLFIKRTIKDTLIFISNIFQHIYWTLYTKSLIHKCFSGSGLKRIKPLRFKFWELKYQKGYKFLLVGNLKKEKVFVKFGLNDQTNENEINILHDLQKQETINILFPLYSEIQRNKEITLSIIIFPFMNYKTLSQIDTFEDFENVCNQAATILDFLFKQNIVHADILARNIFVDGKRLIIFDFDEAFNETIIPVVSYRNHGSHKRYLEEKAILDDANSFSIVIQRLAVNKDWLHTDAYKQVLDRINRLVLVYENNKCYLRRNFSFEISE